jgi:hypothetical protein
MAGEIAAIRPKRCGLGFAAATPSVWFGAAIGTLFVPLLNGLTGDLPDTGFARAGSAAGKAPIPMAMPIAAFSGARL